MNGTELKSEKENEEHLLKTQILQRQWLITIESQRCVPASKIAFRSLPQARAEREAARRLGAA